MPERTIAGRYELLVPLGPGWRARDKELERDVFVRLGAVAEGGATALAHPSIARIFDQGEADGERYVVSEYLPGGSLADKADLSEEEAHAVAADVGGALAYAHAQGVAHGALSPENVLFDSEGRAKVAGFGAAGEPADDVRAFGTILDSLASTAPALAPVAAAALAGELASAELVEQIPRVALAAPPAEEQTVIQRAAVPPEPSRRGPMVLLAIAAAAAVAGGLLAAFLATSGDSNAEAPTTGSLSVPVPTGSTESTNEQTTEAPPAETTTEQTTTEQTEPPTTTAPTTTSPPRATTTAPSPTTAPPPTTEPPPPTTTEAPPPTATTEPTPTATAPSG